MTFRVINNPAYLAKMGFTNTQFKKLDGLYLQAASVKALSYRTVECDFEEGVASYTYYKSEGQAPYLQFIIRKVGPKTMMFEVFLEAKGRVKKSGVFDLAYERLKEEVEKLLPSA